MSRRHMDRTLAVRFVLSVAFVLVVAVASAAESETGAKLPRFGGRDAGLLPERSLLGPVHGAYGDYVMLSENLFPEDIEEQINRCSVPFKNLDGGASVS